jgi:hypothetical protein
MGEDQLEQTILAPDSFYIVCRKDIRGTPTVRAFINWAFGEILVNVDGNGRSS